jgi:hypothetical protein
LSFLHSECRPNRPQEIFFRKPLPDFQLHIHIPNNPRPYVKPLLPYRRIPALPPFSVIDRTVMETDWESMYRSWKEGLGWKNRVCMFSRCEVWLGDMQGTIWADMEWGRTANYVIDGTAASRETVNGPPPPPPPPQPVQNNGHDGIQPAAVQGNEDVQMIDGGGLDDNELIEITFGDPGLDQFQWP